MKVKLTQSYVFEAAHRLTEVPDGHKCKRLHGHTFRVEVRVSGGQLTNGMLLDFFDIDAAASPLIAQLDHTCLNDHPGLENPTSENLARWFWNLLITKLPLLTRISVFENPTSRCDYSE